MAWSDADKDPELEMAQYRTESVAKASWKRVSLVNKKKPTENTYQPTTNYVNSYTPNTEYQHPLVASTKYISKKDQKKKKNGKKKQSLQAKKKDDKKGGREFGLSESDDFDESESRLTTPPPVFSQAQLKNNNTNTNANKKKEEEENLNTFEYWEKPIFIDEDQAMVSKLISSYQIKKVSNNIFYELVVEMRSDERTQIREFGLVALSSTPSVRSFSELTTMKHTDPDTELRNAAGREVTNYYQENRLPHVVSALKVSPQQSPRTAFEALVVLDDATKKYSGVAAFDENNPNPPPVNLNAAAVKPRFEQALGAIEQARLTESPDPKIKAQAVQTEDSLSKFIGTTITTL
ncbi:hypothetical protein K2X05_03510 [bacterium]|nr:hypothetical protein [bacterium]